MKLSLLFCFFIASVFSYAQNINEIDSIANILCIDLSKANPHKSPQNKINTAFEKIALPYIEHQNDTIKVEVSQILFYRIQRGCKVFMDLYNEINGDPTPMKRITKEPKSEIGKEQLKDFKKSKKYWYYENDGTITKIKISANKWISNFVSGTFAKYKLKWIGDNRFEIEFVKSDDYGRSKMNLVGDKFQYKIIKKTENGFQLCEWVKGMQKYSLFELNIGN